MAKTLRAFRGRGGQEAELQGGKNAVKSLVNSSTFLCFSPPWKKNKIIIISWPNCELFAQSQAIGVKESLETAMLSLTTPPSCISQVLAFDGGNICSHSHLKRRDIFNRDTVNLALASSNKAEHSNGQMKFSVSWMGNQKHPWQTHKNGRYPQLSFVKVYCHTSQPILMGWEVWVTRCPF